MLVVVRERMMKQIVILQALLALTVFAGDELNEFDSTADAAKLFHSGEIEQAHQAMRAHLKHDVHPKPDVLLLAARIHEARGSHARAHAILKRLVRETEDHRPWFLLGVVEVKQGGLAEGIKAFKKSLELNPKHGPSYLWLAKASHGNPERSVWLKQALILEPKHSPAAKEALEMLEKLNRKQKDAQHHPGP